MGSCTTAWILINNNLVIQFGKYDGVITNVEGAPVRIIFPTSFTTKYCSFANAISVDWYSDRQGVNSLFTYCVELSNMYIVNDGDSASITGANWLAIGY